MRPWPLIMIGVLGSALSLWPDAHLAGQDQVLSGALRNLFSPLAAPKRKTLGLLQSSFLELGSRSAPLEVAIVVDGTDSMADELAQIRSSAASMIEGLKRLRGQDNVRVAIVIYRDMGSPGGEVEVPLPQFTGASQEITSALEQLKPQDGAPYFYELMDVGLHTAINRLPWSDNPTVSKWIMLFADAPPYEAASADENLPEARRRFANALLVSNATSRGIQIHSLLCSSTEATNTAYQLTLRKTRAVMDQLSTQTGGMVLDLSYPMIRQAFVEKARQPDVEFQEIAPISLARKSAEGVSGGATGDIRLAILPHTLIEEMDFDPSRDETQIATSLYLKFRTLAGVRLVSPLEVERQVRRVRAEGLQGPAALRGLAARLRVDYTIWGRVDESPFQVKTAVLRRRDGERIVLVSHETSPDGLAAVVLNAVSRMDDQDEAIARFARGVMQKQSETFFEAEIASAPSVAKSIRTGVASLEKTLGSDIGQPASVRLLRQGRAALERALQAEPANPLANWLLSNVAYNQAMAAYQEGQNEKAKKLFQESRAALRTAVDRLRDVDSKALQAEIQADYTLLVRRDPQGAARLYESMTQSSMPRDTQRRAHWMLVGLYVGDWGAGPELVNRDRAREHVVTILENWPDGSEAAKLKKWLHWDETKQKSRHHYLPTVNDSLIRLAGLGG
ncbi:MAG: vWA domain-containing protein [Planctomycetota bacterium]